MYYLCIRVCIKECTPLTNLIVCSEGLKRSEKLLFFVSYNIGVCPNAYILPGI
jgi:hypothetical protein